MLKKYALIALFIGASQISYANECQSDKDCKDPSKQFCILAKKPPVCSGPQDKGEPCKRPAVCKSNKCDTKKNICE